MRKAEKVEIINMAKSLLLGYACVTCVHLYNKFRRDGVTMGKCNVYAKSVKHTDLCHHWDTWDSLGKK
jgi:hypothetical protein